MWSGLSLLNLVPSRASLVILKVYIFDSSYGILLQRWNSCHVYFHYLNNFFFFFKCVHSNSLACIAPFSDLNFFSDLSLFFFKNLLEHMDCSRSSSTAISNRMILSCSVCIRESTLNSLRESVKYCEYSGR